MIKTFTPLPYSNHNSGIFIEVNQFCNICQQRAYAASHLHKAGQDKVDPVRRDRDKYLASVNLNENHQSKH